MKKILFRLNAGKKDGYGHLARNLALAEICREKGVEYDFLIASDDLQGVLEFLKGKKEERFHFLPKTYTPYDELEVILTLFKGSSKNVLILDYYQHNPEFLNLLGECDIKWVEYDYLKNKKIFADVVINPNVGVQKSDYQQLVKPGCKICVGRKYIIIRKELQRKIKLKKKENVILIALGGGEYNQEMKDLIFSISCFKQFEFIVISRSEKIKMDLNQFKNVHLIIKPKNISKIYQSCRYAIVAGGVTCNEMAYLNVPMLIVPIAQNQRENAEWWDKMNFSISFESVHHFKDVLSSIGIELILKKLNDKFYRKKVLLDCNGAIRIMDEILDLD